MKTAVITGAGSGVGQAIALKLAHEGWKVAIIGRRADALQDTVKQAGESGKQMLVCPGDIGEVKAVDQMAKWVLTEFKDVEVLVNSAGTNAPKRALEVLSLEDYHMMMNVNLNGAYYCVQAFLPQMRSRGSGTVINIVSDAGKAASPKAGPGYVISKFGMAGLNSAINAEERGHGVRACAIFPGDIDTPILSKRPVVPDAAARAKMMQPEDIAECALLAINLPSRVIIEEMIVRP